MQGRNDMLNRAENLVAWFATCILIAIFSIGFCHGQTIVDSDVVAENRELQDQSKIRILLNSGEELLNTDPVKALDYAKQALLLAKQTNEQVLLMNTYIRLGDIYIKLGNSTLALDNLNQALTYAREIEDNEGIVTIFDNMGKAFSMKGHYDKAMEYHLHSLEIAREQGLDTLTAMAQNSLGVVYAKLYQYDMSMNAFKSSLLIYELMADLDGITGCLNNIGNLYRLQGDYKSSLDYILKALEYSEKQNNQAAIAVAYGNLGQLYKSIGDLEKALSYSIKSLEIKKLLDQKNGIVIAMMQVADIKIEMGNFDEAKEFLDNAFKIASTEELTAEIKKIYYYYFELYEFQGDYKNALEQFKIYSQYKDSIFNKESFDNIANLSVSFELSEKEKEYELLKKTSELKELELSRERSIQNMVIIILVLLITIMIIVLLIIRIKRKAGKKIEEKDSEIIRKNEQLRILNENLEAKVKERTNHLQKEIEERIRIQKELEIAKESAEDANKLKDAFLANMSHEIRTPMNGILGFIELLCEEGVTDEQRKEFAGIIAKSGRHLLTLINDIIDISKLEAGQIKIVLGECNLNKLLNNILLFFSNEPEKNNKNLQLSVSLAFPDKESNIITDITRLTQILTNLINNAIKFTSQGEIEFGYGIEGEDITFFVRDTGKGISEKEQAVIFDRFRQADDSTTRSFGGSGLGLTISSGLIELLGGKIWVESELGKGSVFFFTIPYKTLGTL